jgi:hypothetical protein
MNFNVVKGRLIVLFAEIDFPAVSSPTVQRKSDFCRAFSDPPNLLRKLNEDAFNMRWLAAICSAEQRTIFVFLNQFA